MSSNSAVHRTLRDKAAQADYFNVRRLMSNRSPLIPVAISVAAGIALWLVASALTGKREPWDASAYWAVVYPAAILMSAFLGYSYPERPWRWALVLFESQFLAMCIRNGELGNLWPLGMAVFAIITLPGIAAAKLASRFSRST
jgi:hypothetical protein